MFGIFEVFKYASEIAAWLAGGGLVFVIAIAVGWYLPPFRQTAVAIAVAAAVSTFFIAKGVYLGHSLEAAKWQAAELRAEHRAVEARTSAEQSVASEPSGGVRERTDRYDRDKPPGNVRAVAPHHLFPVKGHP